MDIKGFCHKLESLLAGRNLRAEGLETAVRAICLALGVSAGEMAILLADAKGESLSFLWPRDLQNSGTIPVSSKDSLAARTYRDGSGTINNRFSATRHAGVFEAFPLREQGGKALPIQKIVSVPIASGEQRFGVLQVCRKAVDAADAGADFTSEELRNLARIGQALAGCLPA